MRRFGWLLLLAACASRGRLPGPVPVRAWPAPPEAPRLVLLGEFSSARDLGIRRGPDRGLWALLTGTQTVRLDKPYAVAVHGDAKNTGPGGKRQGPARIAVSDIGAKVVHLIDLERGWHRVIATHSGDVPLLAPVAVAFDARGRLHVCDSAAAVVVRYDIDGKFDTVLSEGFGRPAGLAIDRTRELAYVADAKEHVVRVLDLDGSPRGDLPVRFRFPTHLAVNGAGRLVVSDTMNFRAVVVAPDGEVTATVGGPGDASGNLQRPKGVALDSESHLYALDAIFDNLQIFDLKGRLLLSVGSAGGGPGEFALPAGLAIDERDLVYVADTYNGRIQIFQYVKGDD